MARIREQGTYPGLMSQSAGAVCRAERGSSGSNVTIVLRQTFADGAVVTLVDTVRTPACWFRSTCRLVQGAVTGRKGDLEHDAIIARAFQVVGRCTRLAGS